MPCGDRHGVGGDDSTLGTRGGKGRSERRPRRTLDSVKSPDRQFRSLEKQPTTVLGRCRAGSGVGEPIAVAPKLRIGDRHVCAYNGSRVTADSGVGCQKSRADTGAESPCLRGERQTRDLCKSANLVQMQDLRHGTIGPRKHANVKFPWHSTPVHELASISAVLKESAAVNVWDFQLVEKIFHLMDEAFVTRRPWHLRLSTESIKPEARPPHLASGKPTYRAPIARRGRLAPSGWRYAPTARSFCGWSVAQ
jgi:hypothetical protein